MELLQYTRAGFEQALWALRENRLRTVMSILGIAFGVAAMMTVGIVSESGRRYVFSELESYGLDSVWLYRDWQNDNPYAAVRQGSGIDNEDLAALRECCPAVKRVSPVVYRQEWMITIKVNNNFARASVEGVGMDYLRINNDSLIQGRNFRDIDIRGRRPVAIIGTETSRKLFGENVSPMGKVLRMGEYGLTVIGILKPKARTFLSAIGANTYNQNERILIPYTLYQKMLGSDDIHTLRAQATTQQLIGAAIAQLRDVLERRHKNRFVYISESMDEWIHTANRILGSISLIGLISASVALLVGGMGIMSIMSTAVVERTREIGLRKALGARRKDILLQFLTEAMIISGIGGVLGLILGFAAALGLAGWTGFPLTPSWLLIGVGFFVSAGVGILSGYYPAHRAARLRPVEALRYE